MEAIYSTFSKARVTLMKAGARCWALRKGELITWYILLSYAQNRWGGLRLVLLLVGAW